MCENRQVDVNASDASFVSLDKVLRPMAKLNGQKQILNRASPTVMAEMLKRGGAHDLKIRAARVHHCTALKTSSSTSGSDGSTRSDAVFGK